MRENKQMIQVLDYVLEAFAAMRVSSRSGLVIFQISGSIFLCRAGKERFAGESRFGEGAVGAGSGGFVVGSEGTEDTERSDRIGFVVGSESGIDAGFKGIDG
jgi:hypothetical protein